jgi:flagellar biosynthesis chaperone FliJ
VGSTDYCDLQAAPYSSNYELSEARAQKVKHILIDELLKKDQRQRDIEWFVLPLSSEVSPVTGLPAGDTQVVDCDKRSTPDRTQKKKAHPDSEKELAELQNYKNTFPPMQQQLGQNGVSDLQDKVDDLKKYVGNLHVSEDAIKDRRERIGILTEAMIVLEKAKRENQPEQTISKLTKDKTKKEVELEESLAEFKFVDEAAGMRVVTVSLRPVQESRWFTPLSLMDYMYFTIYTITTTGYGDIVPTTTFAKFLCSAANILEVFFLVVFFNALLSVRGENRFSRVTDKNRA